MKVVRIAFLVVVSLFSIALYLNARSHDPFTNGNYSANLLTNPFTDSFFDTTKPNHPPVEVPFVPVAAFTNFGIDDLSEVDSVIYVADKWYEVISKLPIWQSLGLQLRTYSIEEGAVPSQLPPDGVKIIPLNEVYPYQRVLRINDMDYFNLDSKKEWPLVAEIKQSDSSGLFTINEPIHEMSFGGTVVLSRGVAERIRKYNDPFYPWEKIADLISQDHVHINNFK